MNTEQKRYLFVFTGLFLIIFGGWMYLRSSSKSYRIASEKARARAFVEANRVEKPENVFVSYPRPTKLHYVYGEGDFSRTVSLQAGLKKFTGDKKLSGARVICSGKNCKRQVLTGKSALVYNKQLKPRKTLVVNGDVVFVKGHLDFLKSGVRVAGDVYIKDLNFLKIPKNFRVDGNIYIVNSEGITFMGNNFIDGHIYLSGRSSLRAFPESVRMTGQIFI